MKQRDKPTMSDVARAAGVSQPLVSAVLSGKSAEHIRCSPATRHKIEAAARKLNYRKNLAAEALASARFNAIGLIVSEVVDPFFPEFIQGVVDAASDRGLHVLIRTTGWSPDAEKRAMSAWRDRLVDGFIVCGSGLSTNALQELAADYPMVLAQEDPVRNTGQLIVDHRQGLRSTVGFLKRLGHRRIAHLAGEAGTYLTQSREAFFRSAMRHHKLTVSKRRLFYADGFDIESGRRAAPRVLAELPAFTALVCMGDSLAIGVMQACHQLGVRIPQDISLIGNDDIQASQLVTPGLTTLSIDRLDLGRSAVDMLSRMITASGKSVPAMRVVPTLVQRGSHGSPTQTN